MNRVAQRMGASGGAFVAFPALSALFVFCVVGCGGKTGGGGTDASWYCETTEQCPPGYECIGNLCVPEGDAEVEPDAARVGDIEVNPTALDFGSPLLGVPIVLEATVSNVGNGDLRLTSITLEEDDSFPEFVAQPVGTLNQVISPGSSIVVQVELTNLDAEADTGRLLITSDDPDEPIVQVDLISDLKGAGDLATCVMLSDTLFDNCVVNPEIIDYGVLAYNSVDASDVSIFNNGTGERPLVIHDVYVTNGTGHGNLFTLSFFRFVEDPNNPGQYIEDEVTNFPTQPFYLNVNDGQGVPEAMLVRVQFHAALDGQRVPSEDLVIESDDATPATYSIPIDGFILCPSGFVDVDGLPGCECEITNGGVEVCDGLDNDCDGETDEDVNPGLCLVCDSNGQPAPGTDDDACGVIDCSGWYQRAGTQSPTDTDYCVGRQDITANRCEGAGDCKDDNSDDCASQPLLTTPQVVCGICQRVMDCVGTIPGSCENYMAGTDTGLCRECDGNGAERAAADDAACNIIDCSGWFTKSGQQGPTTTEECRAHQDITSNRCEGMDDCKDPNTADCASQPTASPATVTCGVCKYMEGCMGTIPGNCANYPVTTDTGLCRECDGNGAERMAADDSACGPIDCSQWFVKTGTQGVNTTEYCFGQQPITTGRCEGMDDCKDPNSSDCSGQPQLSTPAVTCDVCKYMSGCSGVTPGQCVFYAPQVDCGLCRVCDGTGGCDFVPDGNDPNNQCAQQAESTCGRDGQCDGAGGCRLWANGTVCQAATCSNHILQREDTCNGEGSCIDGGIQDCSPYQCNAAGNGCRSGCTDNSHCITGYYCNAGTCTPEAPQGTPCNVPGDCASGFCVDGFCCNSLCNGECRACNLPGVEGTCTYSTANTDPEAECGLCRICNATGTCVPAADGTDPKNQCDPEAQSTCGRDGACDGNGACGLYPAGTICVTQTCVVSTKYFADTCNGTGVCSDGGSISCAPYLCSGIDCATTCALDTDCVGGYYCDGTNHCQAKKPNGQGCFAANECTSGYCVDGVCCNNACDGACRACNRSGSLGTCSNHPVNTDPELECGFCRACNGSGACSNAPDGTDPKGECALQSQASCGLDGDCNGDGACGYWPSGTQCASQTCSGSTQYNADYCNGTGTCVDGGSVSCSPYVCSGSSCLTTCLSSSNCVPGYECKNGQCRQWVTLIDQDFDPCPAWTVYNGGTGSATWYCSSSDNDTNSPSGGMYALVNSDENGDWLFGSYEWLQEGLMTPVVNLTGYVEVWLTFWHTYDDVGLGDFARVQYSTNGQSGPWNTLITYTSDIHGVFEALNVSFLAGQSSVSFRFWYDDDDEWAWWWRVDDVVLEAI